jgi:asparagine synthase (glutamine-hydrolysing)
MCSINGFNWQDQDLVRAMNEATKHRGPDGTGSFCDEQISLGHDLLAIADVAEASIQPFVTPDKDFALVFNGEIYNYRELRTELIAKGEIFRTDSDTEVLFAGLRKQGAAFIDRLEGMFAFAFYDKRRATLLLARDQAGMKPLYYYHQDGRFIFSSELRGLLLHDLPRKLDREAASLYFSLGYVPGQKTMITGIKKLRPAELLSFDLRNGKLSHNWHSQGLRRSGEASDEDLSFRFGRAVKAHTMGKRPYGLYLSGGMDSTAILFELAKFQKGNIKTYSTAFVTSDKAINEDAQAAKRLCRDFAIDHHELLISEQDLIAATIPTIRALEEPRYHISMPAYYLLAREASRDITVVLSGSGGDETFLGYPRYLESQRLSRRYGRYPAALLDWWYGRKRQDFFIHDKDLRLHLSRPLDRWLYLNQVNRIRRTDYDRYFRFDSFSLLDYLASSQYPALQSLLTDSENAQAELDRLFWLADEDFIRSDKIMMQFGLEGRFPFVADDLIRFANRVPSAKKLGPGQTKYLFRQAYAGKLPDYIVNKKKSGWYAPTAEWMSSAYGDFVREVLMPSYYPETAELFDLEAICHDFIDGVDKHKLKSLKRFMPVFSFQIWAREFGIKL